MDKHEAYKAMYRFLHKQYSLSEGVLVVDLLSWMALLNEGEPMDPAMWSDWENALSSDSKIYEAKIYSPD